MRPASDVSDVMDDELACLQAHITMANTLCTTYNIKQQPRSNTIKACC
jgi:hypothetical protein